MSKPWDKLRVPPDEPKPLPIGNGEWGADCYGFSPATVWWSKATILGRPAAELTFACQTFSPTGLRELAEFCTELADQLEGK